MEATLHPAPVRIFFLSLSAFNTVFIQVWDISLTFGLYTFETFLTPDNLYTISLSAFITK